MQNFDKESVKRKGSYLLSNMFTTAGLFSGFYAVIAVFVATLCDGRVARMTNTQSELVAEYDRMQIWFLSVLPALIAYSLGIADLVKIDWLAALYLLCRSRSLID